MTERLRHTPLSQAVPLAIAQLADGDFQIEIGPELPLAEASRAHELVEQHAARGKIVLIP